MAVGKQVSTYYANMVDSFDLPLIQVKRLVEDLIAPLMLPVDLKNQLMDDIIDKAQGHTRRTLFICAECPIYILLNDIAGGCYLRD